MANISYSPRPGFTLGAATPAATGGERVPIGPAPGSKGYGGNYGPLPGSPEYAAMMAKPGQPSGIAPALPGPTTYAQPTQNVPATGLIGSEQALMQGFKGAQNSLSGNAQLGISALDNASAQSNAQMGTGTLGAAAARNYGMGVAGDALRKYTGTAGDALNSGYDAAGNVLGNFKVGSLTQDTSLGSDITNPLNEASGNFSGYMSQGNNASKLQADLSGANGQAAQQAAYAAYQSSPAMQYQMEQMQKATERSAAARGGLMSGNVLQELQRNASGIASQDYQNQFNNMGTVANRGLEAANQVAGIKGQQAGIAGNIKSQALANESQRFMQQQDIQAQIASKMAALKESQGIAKANLQTQLGQGLSANRMQAIGQNAAEQYNTGLNTANNTMQLGRSVADIYSNLGTNEANLFGRTADQMSTGRTNAGLNIAGNATHAADNISNLLQNQGIQISDAMRKDVGYVTSALKDAGILESMDQKQLATLLANISTGSASNIQQGYENIGNAQAAGVLGVGKAPGDALKNYVAYKSGKKSPTTEE